MFQLLLLLMLLLFNPTEASVSAESAQWKLTHENLNEYQLVMNMTVAGISNCVYFAGEAGERAVTYNSHTRQCGMYRCKLGVSNGCRKCRNLANGTLPQVWLRTNSRKIASTSISCWRTFQHRVDASVDFYRNWTEYAIGFGQGEDANYWLGLNNIHELAKDRDKRVRWEFSDWTGTFYWAENEFLQVENETNKFKAWLGSFDASASNVGQAIGGHTSMNGMQFTTFDQDNDNSANNCAEYFTGAWWHNSCHMMNPNGRYFTPPQALDLQGDDVSNGIVYDRGDGSPVHQRYSMKTFECMLWHHL